MEYFNSGKIDIVFIRKQVMEMIGDTNLQKLQVHMSFLLEEISYAKYQWELTLAKEDWSKAANILHREKLIIHQLELLNDESLLLKIKNKDPSFTSRELQIFYRELIHVFTELEKLIGPSI
jgi:uncharacterized protein YqgQ